MESNKVRTRFAPSPTGYMHIGNLRTALYAYLIAKGSGGTFILRIEDTDQNRYVEGAVDIIYRTLKSTGLNYDEGPDIGGPCGPYVQSLRKDIYLPYGVELVERGAAYYCFCNKEDAAESDGQKTARAGKCCAGLSKDEIEKRLAAGDPYVIRQNNPATGTTSFYDEIFGEITVDNAELDDMVLIKSDGLPTYNFANVVDDHLMAITHVVRGMEYLSSTPKYNRLYEALGWPVPKYIHCPPIMKDAVSKLSKRNGDASYEDLTAKGYLKDAILNYIALLGWSPGTEREIFNLQDLIEDFDYRRINKSPAIFDIDKLKWMNGEYIRALSAEEFHSATLPYYGGLGSNSDIDLTKVSELLHKRVEVLGDIPGQIDFLSELPKYDISLYIHKKMKTDLQISLTSLEASVPVLENLSDWSHDGIHDALMQLVESLGFKNGQVLWPVRTALTGKQFTPGGAIEIAGILGQGQTIGRLQKGIEKLKGEIGEVS